MFSYAVTGVVGLLIVATVISGVCAFVALWMGGRLG
jgi:hypothetical protein